MKISELMEKMQIALDAHGDIEVKTIEHTTFKPINRVSVAIQSPYRGCVKFKEFILELD